jgi:N-carbamoylputrescine amidase
MRVGFVEWPDGLEAHSTEWAAIAKTVDDAGLDVLVTNELPFGGWIAAWPAFDAGAAQHSIDSHAAGMQSLADLKVAVVLSSRPVWVGQRLANEAVIIQNGELRPWRRKRSFPAEPGWYETQWYVPGDDTFSSEELAGLPAGVLLCTEAMFNERARTYGRGGAALIAIPRATGPAAMWRTAGQMAAIASGSYVVSSNRCGGTFAGDGFAFAPDGTLLAATSQTQWLGSIEIDRGAVERQREAYPCYVVA